MTDRRLCGTGYRAWVWVIPSCLILTLCGCETIVRVVNQNTDGTNEFWVCEGDTTTSCRGERLGDIDPAGYQKRLQVVAPPKECTHGTVAAMDIVIERGKIVRVRYECGLPPQPTGLPPSTLPSPRGTETPHTN